MIYLPLQIIVSLFIVFVVYRLLKRYKDGSLKMSEFIGWLLIWLAVLVVFWLPQTTSYLANLVGIGRGVDLAVYLSILLVFYLNFRLYLRIDNQNKEITKIVRHLALHEEESDKERK
jgi:small membrane protein